VFPQKKHGKRAAMSRNDNIRMVGFGKEPMMCRKMFSDLTVEIAYLQCATSAKLTHAKKIQKVSPKFPEVVVEADLHIA
jgi:hypothetical protein